jgi:hypothetical protein
MRLDDAASEHGTNGGAHEKHERRDHEHRERHFHDRRAGRDGAAGKNEAVGNHGAAQANHGEHAPRDGERKAFAPRGERRPFDRDHSHAKPMPQTAMAMAFEKFRNKGK